ncbi:MAG TPA: GIY-YIG nuclease family protein [Methanoregulaceae archaeon]|nr:GIY-YIG nuclease family protein [Methanoregulaceae archaeon]
MEKGVYCLVLRSVPCRVKVGSLGDIDFPAGWVVYTGSAMGLGGLSRVSRHCRLYSSLTGKIRWHIDYLLTDPGFILCCVISAPTAIPLECNIARTIGGRPVPHLGSSDCHCPSHLHYFRTDPCDRVAGCFRSFGLDPDIVTINTVER